MRKTHIVSLKTLDTEL